MFYSRYNKPECPDGSSSCGCGNGNCATTTLQTNVANPKNECCGHGTQNSCGVNTETIYYTSKKEEAVSKMKKQKQNKNYKNVFQNPSRHIGTKEKYGRVNTLRSSNSKHSRNIGSFVGIF